MFRKYLENESNLTRTENLARAYKSTKSKVLDLFGLGGSALQKTNLELEGMVAEAFNENPMLAARVVFYLGDVRGGQGVRKVFKVGLKVIMNRYPEIIEDLIELIPEYTRWDMLYEFVGTKCEEYAFYIMRRVAFHADRERKNHLIFKWLKSPKTSSKESTRLGRLTAKYFGMTEKQYRKFLARNRARMNIVERKMSSQDWDGIDYSAVPSKASLQYREAFKRHDGYRYEQYIERVNRGEEKMNMNVTYPHEIVNKYTNGHWIYSPQEFDPVLEAAWKSLPVYNGHGNILTIADVSGSMSSKVNSQSSVSCMDVSIALAIYTAENNVGEFNNIFMTFSENPELIQINERDSLRDKLVRVANSEWGVNTNIDRAFDLILRTAVRNNVPREELPETVLIISDMQFDECSNIDKANYDHWKENFANHGYALPQIVFWQVSTRSNVPVQYSQSGAAIVSGFSPSILKFIYENKIVNPFEFMLEVVMTERYDAVGDLFE